MTDIDNDFTDDFPPVYCDCGEEACRRYFPMCSCCGAEAERGMRDERTNYPR